MDPRLLAPIPTPPAQRWREMRLVYLPRVLFALGAVFVAWAWRDAVTPSTIVAEAEVLGSDLRATQGGVIASMKVRLHQNVRAGEVVGHVAAANPRLLDATLAVINAEVGMLRATMSGTTDRQRVALEFERLQLDWMGHRVERAALHGRLQLVDADITRAEPLHRAGLMSQQDFAQLKLNRDALAAQIEEKNKLITRLEPALSGLAVTELAADGLSGEPALAAAIKVQEAKLRLAEEQLSPVPLIAPIEGVVAVLMRRPGETVMAGDAILRVTSTKPERLAGYLRQPLPFNPKVGAAARIRTRGTPAISAPSTITFVGAGLESISPTLLPALRLPMNMPVETGLRVEFTMPPGLELRPGEHVDVIVR
jgi:multidrug resistance efflux pump